MSIERYDHLPTGELLRRALAESADGGDPDTRWSFVSSLHFRPEPAVFAQASAWCRAAEPAERTLGADILGQLGCKTRPRPLLAESTPILVALLRDPSDQVVASALIALGHLDAGEPAEIVRLATHPSPDVRHAVAFALGGREDSVSVAALVALSGDEAADVRDWATFAIGTLSEADTPAIRNALLERLTDEDRDVRGEAMRGLASRGDARATPAIVRELQAEDVGSLAIEAADHLASPEFLPHLERLLERCPTDEQIQAAIRKCRGPATSD